MALNFSYITIPRMNGILKHCSNIALGISILPPSKKTAELQSMTASLAALYTIVYSARNCLLQETHHRNLTSTEWAFWHAVEDVLLDCDNLLSDLAKQVKKPKGCHAWLKWLSSLIWPVHDATGVQDAVLEAATEPSATATEILRHKILLSCWGDITMLVTRIVALQASTGPENLLLGFNPKSSIAELDLAVQLLRTFLHSSANAVQRRAAHKVVKDDEKTADCVQRSLVCLANAKALLDCINFET